MESYLNKISEQVIDEDKIVTYKSLSRNLGIHVNTAKQLLYTYLTNEKSKNSFPISATYLVAGKVVDGSFNITIVNEADLKKAHSTFVEITSEHVYSVQKGKALKELQVLSGIKELSNSENSKLVITCSKGVLKSRPKDKKKLESWKENSKKVISQALLPEKVNDLVQETNKKAETTKSKESSSKSPKKTSPKGNAQKSQGNVKKPGGNIANLFAKAAQKNAEKTTNEGKLDKNLGKTTTDETLDENTSKAVPKEIESVDVDVGEKIEPQKAERKNLEISIESKESLKKKINGNKRKRIQMLSDSEESDSNDEEKIDKEEIEDSPPNAVNIDEEEEEEKEDAKEFIPRNKRKKRKVIDRTVMNEDGYLETKKEVVFETDSENELEEDAAASKVTKKPKVEPANHKGKDGQAAAGTAKKQSSLLTFFKKN